MAPINIELEFLTYSACFRLDSTSQARALEHAIAQHLGYPRPGEFRILFNGDRVTSNQTIASQWTENETSVVFMMEQGGPSYHPGLYMQTPEKIDWVCWEIVYAPGPETRRLDFLPKAAWRSGGMDWRGSLRGLRNLPLEQRGAGDMEGTVEWDIAAGSFDQNSEAKQHTRLDDSNAVVLTYTEVAPYIQGVFDALSIDRGISYGFLRNYYNALIATPYLAVRFVDQASYERIAPISIWPPPQVMARIVMLFQHVEQAELGCWKGAMARAKAGSSLWKDVVGYDGRVADQNAYRVLEWRAIEVTEDCKYCRYKTWGDTAHRASAPGLRPRPSICIVG
ncbi:unnamed protein product [Peniophora sp. CBMAI 1063]|nr:unnamed protein product [Peniophora sp. CBMAI 1063]